MNIKADTRLNPSKGGSPLNGKSRLVATLAVAAVWLALALPAPASAAFLQDWFIDVDGVGGAAPVKIHEWIDTVGAAYIQNNLGAGTFSEFGAFKGVSHDGGLAVPGTAELTGTLTATGTFTLGGTVSFTGGTLKIYSDAGNDFASTNGIYGADNGTLIGTFTVLPGGGGPIQASGVPNGNITALLSSTFLAPGFWFAPDGVTPLSSLGFVLGFATTNASALQNPVDPTIVSEIGCQGLLGGVNCGSIHNLPPGDLFVSGNGQFRLAIPEPSSLMLLGGGLLLVGLLRRKKA
jgi:hypothetical protein